MPVVLTPDRNERILAADGRTVMLCRPGIDAIAEGTLHVEDFPERIHVVVDFGWGNVSLSARAIAPKWAS